MSNAKLLLISGTMAAVVIAAVLVLQMLCF